MAAILEVKNLTKHYDGFTLDHVSFQVPGGCIMGLVGENGAGKSTTIKAILDLVHKDEGTVTFWGQELSGSSDLKEDIGVVFDGISFYETLTLSRWEGSWGRPTGAGMTDFTNSIWNDFLYPKKRRSRAFPRG